MAENNRIKVSGYAKRIFFNDNIEYRDFSPDLVGLQLTSEGGTTLFTNGNFSIDANLDPKPNVVFKQGAKSKLYCLDDIVSNPTEETIQKNIQTKLNLDLTNPLSYIWYGSSEELIRSSLLEIQNNWPAAIYVDNKVGSVTGNNITNYVYNISKDESTFTVNSRFFDNPYGIKYTLDSAYIPDDDTSNKLRNFTVSYGSYLIEHNGISKNIKNITPSLQTTNSDVEIVADGNPFPELTGIYIPTLSFLFTNVDASIPYFIKPNETEIEGFFTSLNDFQSNILTRETNPPYNSIIIATEPTDDGIITTYKETLLFPVLKDGYNLNFFDSFYLSYLDKINTIGTGLDDSKTDIILRKYTTEVISSFDTVPRGDGDDLTLNGEKATKLLRIYGVEFDEVKKYINGIKFAHVVTYNKKDNVPDSLVKDLSHMLGLDPVTFVTTTTFNDLLLPSNGSGQFSGTSVNYTQKQIDTELYRRLILNIAWLWKSKGTRKAIEFLFRFIGAPESLVNFNEYIVMVDKPLDMDEIKKLLFIYTGEVSEIDLNNIPYDKNGYPLPPIDGQLVVTDFIDPETGQLVQGGTTDMYFQKGGGWYRETYGSGSTTILNGNNPHVGEYDGGNEYLQYFSRCYIPNFNSEPTVTVTADTIVKNYFINYNYGIFNGIPTGTTDFYTSQLTYNDITNQYQPIDNCVDVNYSIIETPLQNDGKTTFQQQYGVANTQYLEFLEKIKVDSYLQYSPEWQVIKTNYELAQSNCLLEVSSEGCDDNNTLEICINELPDVLPFNCDTLSGITDCAPFLYFVDENGTKVTFDGFGGEKGCCVGYKDPNNRRNYDFQHVTYVNESGVRAEYCSEKAPCIGKPSGEHTESGIVIFITEHNTKPTGVYTLPNGDCVQPIKPFNNSKDEYFFFQDLIRQGVIPEGITSYQLLFQYIDKHGVKEILALMYELFTIVDCTPNTTISSPECCAWHGYDYQIVTGRDGNEYVVCVENGDQNITELSTKPLPVELQYPNVDIGVNTTYNEYQNPIGDIASYYTTNMFKDCFEESVILLGPDPHSNSLYITPNSLFSSSTLNNPSEWKVNTIDSLGRVSFTPKDPFYDFVLDWNSIDQLSVLYQQVANFYGYTFGEFTFNCEGVLIPYQENSPNPTNGDTIISRSRSDYFVATPNDIITAAVDNSRIGCNDINNISVTFASEKWQGFRLPELDDCSCTIDFSFDYMLKYSVENLMECTNKNICNPTIFNDVSLNNLNCRNFITFTSNKEDPSDPNSLINNFNNGSNGVWEREGNDGRIERDGNDGRIRRWRPKEEYVVWQNNNCIIEPNVDCCNAIGGNVVSVNEWASVNENWVNYINEQHQDIKDGVIIKENFPVELTDSIHNFDDTLNNLNVILNGCYTILLSDTEFCDIDYSQYISTTDICSLDVPLECGLWTKTLSDHKKLITSVKKVMQQFQTKCGNTSVTNIDGTSNISDTTPRVNVANEKATNKQLLTRDKNTTQTRLNDEISNLLIERSSLDKKIIDIDEQIQQRKSDNIIIAQATTEISTNLDCTTYSIKIKELNDFNYNGFCSTQVYGASRLNSLNKINEFNSCVNTQKLINENELLVYNNLLINCQTYNDLQNRLIQAKFENNTVLINELNREIFQTQTRINLETQKGSEFIESDSSLQESELQVNDTLNTINQTAKLLNTTTESITDANGSLSLTTSEQTNLNILSVKNKSQISSLEVEKGNLESLKLNNITKTNEINRSRSGNNLGPTLLSWGVGLIGAGLFLKGILDPETTTGVITAALGAVSQQTPPPDKEGCSYVNGTQFIVTDPASSTGSYQYVITNYDTSADVLCRSWGTGTWTLWDANTNTYQKGCCRAIRTEYTAEGETLTASVAVAATTGGETTNPCTVQSINPSTGEVLFVGGTTTKDCCDGNILGYPVTYNPLTRTCHKLLTPPSCPTPEDVFTTSQNPIGQILFNGEPLTQECCGHAGFEWTVNGCYPIGFVPPLDCPSSDDVLFVSESGLILFNGEPLPQECCGKESTLGFESEYISQANTEIVSGCYRILKEIPDPCCDNGMITELEIVLSNLQIKLLEIEIKTQTCYSNWLNTLNQNFQNYLELEQKNYLKYLDDLKINFKLFVNNGVDINTNIDSGLSYLPYTESINPIWEWDPTQQYSGVILSGSEIEIATIEDAIFDSLSIQNINFSPDMFEPNWQTLNYTIPECVCDDLRRLYPNKEYFFSIEIENYECSVCLLVDNIRVNVTDCQTKRLISLNDCLTPQLSCVIDNKKSWVYTDQGVVTETIYPDGECNSESTNNSTITKLTTPEERLWTNLEYRYTNYDVNHSDLIVNVKNASFSIDPSKAIECDVYDFWKNIDCDNCPTSCTTGETITFSGQVYTSTTLGDYTLDVSASTSGITFSCDTYVSILTDQVLELKNDYYSLTADYNKSLDANYYDLLNKGGSLSKFYIQKNNCGSDTIVINNNNNLDNLFGLITEDNDGKLSFYESYIYSGSTPYVGGTLTEVLSGITAQTFNQTTGVTSECCTSLNELINDKGTLGLGVGKNYVWDTTTSSCTWKSLTICKGDCSYYGTKKVISGEGCVSAATLPTIEYTLNMWCPKCYIYSSATYIYTNGFGDTITGDLVLGENVTICAVSGSLSTITPVNTVISITQGPPCTLPYDTTIDVCVSPLDYLDFAPSQINTKADFDSMVLSNLIDVKSRQTISDYPTLRLFYQLYLTANNCGKELSGKLTYNSLFEFMDKIGDYWLDLLEQVVPATTIWEGCDNSGKIFRNTIFDQNKFNYKKYNLNVVCGNLCPVSGKTDFSIGSQDVYMVFEGVPLYPTNLEIQNTKNDILTNKVLISNTQNQLKQLNKTLCSLNLQDIGTPDLQSNIDNVIVTISGTNEILTTQQTELSNLLLELVKQQTDYTLQQQDYYSKFLSCSGLTESLVNAQNDLVNFVPGTTNYERQRNFIANVRSNLNKCIRKSYMLKTRGDGKAFITQIYDTNEYEGNVVILGDPDWDPDGPFYNTELIHNCI